MSKRKVEVLKGEEWVEVKDVNGIAALTPGDQFKLYEPDGTLVGETAYIATSAPYTGEEGEYTIDAEPVNEQVSA